MNSIKGWLGILQNVEWKTFSVPRPEVVNQPPNTATKKCEGPQGNSGPVSLVTVVNQTSKTATKKCEDPQGNGNSGPLSSVAISSQNPDVTSHESSTAQLVGSLSQIMDVDNPSGEVYKPPHSQQGTPQNTQTEYDAIGSIGSSSSTAHLIVDLQKNIDVENASGETYIPPYDHIQPRGKDKIFRQGGLIGFVAGVLLVVLCFLIAAAIALGLRNKDHQEVIHKTLDINESTDPAVAMEYMDHDIYESTVDLNVKVNETFQAALANNTSSEFLEFQERFCNNTKQTLPERVTDVQSCRINKLSNGSIIVNSTLVIQSNKKISQKYLLNVLKDGNTSKSDSISPDNDSASSGNDSTSSGNDSTSHLRWGDLLVDKVEITRFVSRFVETCAEGDIFDCSTESTCRFFPLNNTYPSNCNLFQACFNNRGEKLQCPEGLEFAYVSSSDTVICKKPSNSTYCGLRRVREQIDRPTDQVDSPTDQPSNICTKKFPLFKNLPHIYDCPQDGREHFIPTRDTYPNNCSNYTRCVNGQPYQFSTPNGTHFVYTSNAQFAPFDYSTTIKTYCVQRHMYSDCLKTNGLPDEKL